MNFNKHWHLKGKHAFLGASKYHWIRYDDEKLIDSYSNHMAAIQGTELHDLAATLIKMRQKLPRSKKTLNSFVNDAIGYGMLPEQILYYSENCFGTTDAISFKQKLLRIHDYKSGVTLASMDQLFIYVALFCLEYRYHPNDIQIETRIYQNDEILVANPDAEIIIPIIDRIVSFDKIISKIKSEGEL